MARKTFRMTLGTDLGEGQFRVDANPARNASDDVADAVTAKTALDALVTTADGAADDVLATATTADDEAALAVGALQTTLTDAVAAAQLIGAGDASAEIDAIDTAVQALVAKTAEVKTATAAAKVDATAVEAATAAVAAEADVDAALTAATASAAGDLAVTLDTAVVTSRNALRRLIDRFLQAMDSSGIV